MSSLTKMLSILDLFDAGHPLLTADQIIVSTNCTRPTGYRYLRELCQAGLLSRLEGTYMLGARIIELDRHIKESDPLLKASLPVLAQLRNHFQSDILLTVYLGGKVIVIHHERGSPQIPMSYSRGTVMPLFRGAVSKAIVANLPVAQQKRLFKSHTQEIAAVGMGENWGTFRKKLQAMRRAGCLVSHGELDPGLSGIAVPISVEGAPPAGLILVFGDAHYRVLNLPLVTEILGAAKAQIEASLSQQKLLETPIASNV